jgi:hypothetical protein
MKYKFESAHLHLLLLERLDLEEMLSGAIAPRVLRVVCVCA